MRRSLLVVFHASVFWLKSNLKTWNTSRKCFLIKLVKPHLTSLK